MATYNQTQVGSWLTDATWGGGGHPSANGDDVNVNFVLTYDAGASAVQYNAVAINNNGKIKNKNFRQLTSEVKWKS